MCDIKQESRLKQNLKHQQNIQTNEKSVNMSLIAKRVETICNISREEIEKCQKMFREIGLKHASKALFLLPTENYSI